MPRKILLRLQTPLRLKREGRLIKPEDLTLALFLNALRLRLRDLLHLYNKTDQVFHLPEIPDAIEAAVLAKELRWQDWTRYSNRQKVKMKMGGVIGEMELDLLDLAEWWKLLWYGQWLHVGKQTSMGLGQYRLAVQA